MKKFNFRRFFSLILAFALVMSLAQPLSVWAAPTTVYLDPANGADTNAGTEAAPVKTLAKAYEKIALSGGTVVFLSNLTWSASDFFPACDHPVTLTSKTGAEGIVASANMRMQADTTFTNITLTFNNSGMMMLSGEGHNLTIEADVKVVRNTTSQLNITPAARFGSTITANPTLTVKAGSWNYVYAAHGIGVNGDINVVIDGATVGTFSPDYNGKVTGNVNVTVKNSSVTTTYLQPSHADGIITGNLNVTLADNAKTKTAASKGAVQGTANVIVDGANQDITTLAGTGTNSKLILRSGNAIGGTNFASTTVDVAEGKTLTILDPITADTVTCAGTLVFTEGGSLNAKAVTGTVNCTVSGEVLANKALVTAPADANFVFPEETGVMNVNGTWMAVDKGNFKGLIVKAESDVTMVFYKDHDREAADKIQPDFTETVDGYTYYYFAGVSGYYCFDASRTGDYTIYQRVYVSAAERDAGYIEEVIMQSKANPSKAEWDHRYYYGQVDELIELTEKDMSEPWHTEVPLVTPVFTDPNKPAHQMTTQPELEAFIANLDDADDNMYVFSIGKSAKYAFDIPIVFFTKTDLSDCTTLEEVAEKLEKSGLKNIGYKAQMHGDEHAAGEGALNVIHMLDQEENQYLLDSINIYVMPRINPDGAYECQRNLRSQSIIYSDVTDSTDPNRHNITLAAHEARLYMRTVQLFDPVAELDGHERQRSSNIGDNQISSSWRYGSGQEMLDLQVDLIYYLFDALKEVGLSGAWYSDNVNTTPGANTRSFAAMQSRIHLLMETRGIYLGMENYGSRVASHIVTAMAYLEYCAEHVDYMAQVVAQQQADLVNNGKTYEEDDVIILASTTVAHPEYTVTTEKYNFAKGTVDSNYQQVGYIYEPTRTRVAPTAYVLPADLPQMDLILELMDLQEINYYYLEPNTAISLQQYSGTVNTETRVTSNVILSTEQQYAFPNGCYVFQMDQVNSYVLAILMEPDNSTHDLVEQGRISVNDDGTFPIYRYIHDLTEGEIGIAYTSAAPAPNGLTSVNATTAANDGKITGLDASKLYEYKLGGADTYTQVAAGATEITGLAPGAYYIRYQAVGGAIGMDAECVVGCSATVYLSAANGSDDNSGTSESAPLATLEAAYAKLAAIFGSSGDASEGIIVLLDNYTITTSARLDLPSHSYPVTIKGKTQSVKLTFNPTNMTEATQALAFHGPTTLDNLTFHAASTSKYDYIYACGNKLVITATVKTTSARSTTFPFLVAGDYKTTVANANLTVLGGRWQSVYATGFKASHTGLAQLTVDGTSVTLNGPVRLTYSGTPSGDTKITLSNLAAGTAYLGTYYSGNVSGDVTLILKENVSGTIYTGCRKSGNMSGTVTVVADGVDLDDMTFINAPGTDNTSGTVAKAVLSFASGEAVPVEGFDEIHINTDGVVELGADLAVDKISGGGTVELNGHKLTSNGIYGIDADVEKVSLRANAEGLYFTGAFDVADELEATYGIALSVDTNKPVAQDNTTSLYTVGETSVLVKDILKAGGADMEIYARAYVKLSDGTAVYGETVSVTFRQLVYAADRMWDSLSAAQQQTLKDLYAANAATLSSWNIPNIT